MDLVGKRFYYFLFSVAIILSGVAATAFFGLRFGIDFTGGFLLEIETEQPVSIDDVTQRARVSGIEGVTVQSSGKQSVFIRGKDVTDAQKQTLFAKVGEIGGNVTEQRFELVGPTIGAELARNASRAVVFASIAILGYIMWAFRTVPRPASSFRFAVCTIIALVHDVLVVVGAFAIFGKVWGVEIDTLFVTALLTVIGYSVHDSIVVLDRIRENLKKFRGASFAEVANVSLLQTMNRSITTSLTVVFVLVGLLLFGGTNIFWFVVALLIGIVTGTYSSLFIATPLLVWWQERTIPPVSPPRG
ncbi:MAG: protein translocase subunit SecF [bacterium]|nr:protein translocase subunit SecF [bacterium]